MGDSKVDFQHMVEALDDALHTREAGVERWSESGMFTAHDPATGISAYVHFGVLAARTWEAIFAVFLPNGELLVSRTFGAHDDGPAMRTAEATLEPVVPREAWRMRYDGVARRVLMSDLAAGPLTDGPVEFVELDLIGAATCPAYGTRPKASGGARDQALLGDVDPARTNEQVAGTLAGPNAVSGSGLHVEQSMKVTGEIRIAGNTIRFDGVGHRDHSCGPRDHSHMWRESWINGSFPSGRTFHALQVYVTGRPTYFMGYVWEGGRFREMTDYTGPLMSGPLGQPWDYRASFDCDGVRQEIRGELLGALPMTVNAPQGIHVGVAPGLPLTAQGPTRWTWDGETGYGWTERVFTPGGWLATTGIGVR